MFSVRLFNITINCLGKDVNSTFITLTEEAREVFLSPGWGRGQYKGKSHAHEQRDVNNLITISQCILSAEHSPDDVGD